MLADDRLKLAPQLHLIQSTDHWTEVVLYRETNWQVALIVIRPDVVVPRHRHVRVDSCDVALGGSGIVDIEPLHHGRIGEKAMRGPLAANLIRVPRRAWHGGKTGPQGGVFLSFQQWFGEPGMISEDWEPWIQPL